jgi:hypothetical protein
MTHTVASPTLGAGATIRQRREALRLSRQALAVPGRAGFGRKKQYVVETNEKIVERCIVVLRGTLPEGLASGRHLPDRVGPWCRSQ